MKNVPKHDWKLLVFYKVKVIGVGGRSYGTPCIVSERKEAQAGKVGELNPTDVTTKPTRVCRFQPLSP